MLNNLTAKENYRIFCEDNKSIPLFMQAWWMDAVCKSDSWDVFLYKKNNRIVAVWVYHFVKKMGFKIILPPKLTQTNGIWIDYSENYSKNERLSYEKEAMTNLIQQFDKLDFSYYDQSFHYSITNWLPLFWNGFSQTTRYTYQIQDISNSNKYFNEFKKSKKSHIIKAEKLIKTDFELTGEEFYNHLEYNLNSVGKKVYYSKEFFLRLHDACKSRNQGCIMSAYDEKNNFHAALFIVWDENIAYNLISTINPQFRSSGASSLLFFEIIKHMSLKTKVFDFEGSMNENIEKSFREFGAIQIPYFRITKYKSLLFKILFNLKNRG